MEKRIKVTIDSIQVRKSESYDGWFSEPGNSAEWSLNITVDSQQYNWRADNVRDNSDHPVGREFYVDVNNNKTQFVVRCSGIEIDDSSANDPLPANELTLGQSNDWGIGSTQTLSAANDDFNYKVFFTVTKVYQFNDIELSRIRTRLDLTEFIQP
ncbi:hypothetical protein [Larkinella sp.]|uniref:hypothetical protein n=1 Tax=Larkinella sp. TaxID=2034517 RepID=UPI003BAB3044